VIERQAIDELVLIPDVDSKRLRVTVLGSPAAQGYKAQVIVTARRDQVAKAEGAVEPSSPCPSALVSGPRTPFLYDLG
jgi:hypothetical protein